MSASVCSGTQVPEWTWITAWRWPEASESQADMTSLEAWWPSPVTSEIWAIPLHGAGASAAATPVRAQAETAEAVRVRSARRAWARTRMGALPFEELVIQDDGRRPGGAPSRRSPGSVAHAPRAGAAVG